MKYLIICGGSVSGIGKGTIVSSVGVILKACGFRVTSIKIDPYLNVDAGTMSPYEHGEVFVLDDGGEVDLDLGNYERFLNVTLTRDHNITTGKIYKSILEKERRGDYLGKTVQVVPHVTDEIQAWIATVARVPVGKLHPGGSPKIPDQLDTPEICLIEVGGTVGDIEGATYYEAIRQLILRIGPENVCLGFVSFVPFMRSVGELKTKPTQHGVKELRALGLNPDMILCRCEVPLSLAAREKVALFTSVNASRVFFLEDVANVYKVPAKLEEQKISHEICKKLGLKPKTPDLTKWDSYSNLFSQLEESPEKLKIAVVGKYTGLPDSYLSLTTALKHAAMATRKPLEILWIEAENLEDKNHPDWELLLKAEGVLIPGGFGNRGVEGKILAAEYSRTNQKPYLGVCLGMQVAVIEYCRNVLGLQANSSEMDTLTPNPVVIDMPELDHSHKGGTMRLGSRVTLVQENTLANKVFNGSAAVLERHRHRFEVNPEYIEKIEEAGMVFSGKDESNTRMEIMELPQETHPFYFGTQFHPELKTKPFVPSPPFYAFLLASAKHPIEENLDVSKINFASN